MLFVLAGSPESDLKPVFLLTVFLNKKRLTVAKVEASLLVFLLCEIE